MSWEFSHPKPCPSCKSPADIQDLHLGAPGPYVITCGGGCYDGAPDAGKQLICSGTRLHDVVEAWNEKVEEASDVTT